MCKDDKNSGGNESFPLPSSTEELRNYLLNNIDNPQDLRYQYLERLQKDPIQWAEKMKEILEVTGYSVPQMAQLCQVSPPTVRRWLNGTAVPGNRDTLIRIGFAAGYTREQMDRFLQRYGRYHGLYVKSLSETSSGIKSPEDSVYIFVLESKTLPHTYETCQEILTRLQNRLLGQQDAPKAAESAPRASTELLDRALQQMETQEELESFLDEQMAAFTSSFGPFYDYILPFLERDLTGELAQDKLTMNRMARDQGWTKGLTACVSAIHQRKWVPRRNMVISLALHLNQYLEGLDEMLELAHMEPLCAKNPVEAMVIFAAMDAELNDMIQPIPKNLQFMYPNASMELCTHVRKIVLTNLDLLDEGDEKYARYIAEELLMHVSKQDWEKVSDRMEEGETRTH